MDVELREKLAEKLSLELGQKESQQIDKYIPYGTAGFRGPAATIKHLFYKVGIVAGLRCIQKGANIGIMITASHNPIQDNGVKLVDPEGGMLEQEWEQVVEKFCNIQEPEQLLDQVDMLCKQYGIELKATEAKVLIGMDTRPSSEALVALVKQGLDLWTPSISFFDYGQVTTPLLHYLVARSNLAETASVTPKNYYDQLIDGLYNVFNRAPGNTELYSSNNLVVDCANGVGTETMNYFRSSTKFNQCLGIKLINTGDGILNKLCGADFVKSTHGVPTGADDVAARYASLDGDADRLVYFYLEHDDDKLKLNLLDGDKIMALYALYMKEMLEKANLSEELTFGLVQTAYANGASTDYLRNTLGIEHVDCVDTGVKNLHAQAVKYDIGIYFEANGHGTIWFSDKAKSLIQNLSDDHVDLKELPPIINNYTGDAISDILVVESILRFYDWDVKTWDKIYTDRSNSLIKVQVPDRSQISTTNAGRTCTRPEGIQEGIDSMLDNYGPGARCFVRPSGTEDCVRIYAEAQDQSLADKLSQDVGELVRKLCGGNQE